MKVPFLLSKKENKEYILALLLRDEKITVVILEEQAHVLRVVTHNETRLTTIVEQVPFEELLDVLDKTISSAESVLPQSHVLQKTVFGVKQSWVEDAKIKKDYLVMLKKLSEELTLQPIGFLVFAEAIAHLLQKEEGAPVSALLVETGKKITTVSLLRAGRLGEARSMQNEASIIKTVDTLLTYFESVEILPSRIILFDAEDNKKVEQTFISHTWSRNLPFLHVPQITVLPTEFDIKAILYGTATQLGFDVDEASEIQSVVKSTDATFTEKTPETTSPDTEGKAEGTPMNPEKFGFIINQDIAEKAVKEEKSQVIAEIPEEVKEQTTGESKHKESLPKDATLLFSGIRNVGQTLRQIFFNKKKTPVAMHEENVVEETTPKHQSRNENRPMKKILFVFPVIVLILIGMLYAYMTLIKATVTIHVKPKVVDKSQDMTFAIDTSADLSHNMLSGTVTSFGEDGSLATPATGTKDVGDPAKGTITIYNKLTDPVTIPKGTTVTSPNGLKFTLDQSVTVASASGASDPTAPTTPGTAHVPVTAANFGPDYNLPSNTRFSIGNTTGGAAKNDNPFSGGTKKQVTIVAKADVDKLISDLTKNLEDKAKSELDKKSSTDKSMLPGFVKEDMTKKDFDKKVGDEAKNITLRGTVTFDTIAYDKKQLDDYANVLLKNILTSDTTLAPNGLTYTLKNIKQKSDKEISATVALLTKLLPKLAAQKIAETIKGKSFADASNSLQSLPQVTNATITLHPNLFFLPKILPRNEKNISIVTSND